MRCLRIYGENGNLVRLPLDLVSEIHLRHHPDRFDYVVTISGQMFDLFGGLIIEEYYSTKEIRELEEKRESELAKRAKELGVPKENLRSHCCFMVGDEMIKR